MVGRWWRVLAAAVALAAGAASAGGGGGGAAPLQLSDLAEASAAGRNGVIEVSSVEQWEAALAGPRAADLVLLVVAGPRMRCTICDEADRAVSRLAAEFREARAPLYFLRVDASRVPQMVQRHRISTAPVIYFISKTARLDPHSAVLSRGKYLYDFDQAKKMSADGVLEFIKKFVPEEVTKDVLLRASLGERVTRAALVFAIFIASSAFGVYSLSLLRRRPWLMVPGALLIQWLATSGLCWVVIHGAPFVGRERLSGRPLIFAAQRRSQYAAEGLLMSALVVGLALLLLAATLLLEKGAFKSPSANAGAAIICAAVSYFIFTKVVKIYTQKAGFAAPTSLFPPADYVSGPLWLDRGNQF